MVMLDTMVKHLLEGRPFIPPQADDIALIVDSKAEFQLKIRKWQATLADAELNLSTKNSEVMNSTEEDDQALTWREMLPRRQKNPTIWEVS
ncbi:hypothetical protein Y032_0018g3606 [Ancylostoma ceylanicum]|uniref:Uncharacterized protein n=1 Tax=Ancylostoma ceylanicum TaxID=53326 RepID=A0A016V3T3_9BILA|nr:hypothetical protein Y032_0018g3606 [Ancylostoma ceylanicum]